MKNSHAQHVEGVLKISAKTAIMNDSRSGLLRLVGFTTCAISFFLPLSAPAVADKDIVSTGSGLTLGSGWYGRETSDGKTFHWAENGAAIVIHHPQSSLKKLSIDIQGGPGLANAQNFVLHLKDPENHDIAVVHVPGTQTIRFDVPVEPGKDEIVKLFVDGGGKKVPKDPRVLNFRAFDIADASGDVKMGAGHPDVAFGSVQVEKNWYPLEQYGGETFRWVANDAEFTVTSSKDETRRFEITAASGPDVQSPAKWTLSVEDGSGKVIQVAQIKARGTAYFDLPLKRGSNSFKLHVHSTNAKNPGDARTLSFRVFSMALD